MASNGLSKKQIFDISSKIFASNLLNSQSPREFLDEVFYQHSAENLTQFYNVSLGVMEKFINYSIPCMEKVITENVNLTHAHVWVPVMTDW